MPNRRKAYHSDYYLIFTHRIGQAAAIVMERKPSRWRAVPSEGVDYDKSGNPIYIKHHVFHVKLDKALPMRSCYLVSRTSYELDFETENELIAHAFRWLQQYEQFAQSFVMSG